MAVDDIANMDPQRVDRERHGKEPKPNAGVRIVLREIEPLLEQAKQAQPTGTYEMPEKPTLDDVLAAVTGFAVPVLAAVARGESFEMTWPAGGPWTARRTG